MGGTEVSVLEENDQFTHVKVLGRLDTAGINEVERRFVAAICPRGKHAIVDLSGVSFLASLGIRMLVTTARTLARSGAKLVLYAPAPLVQQSIQRAGLADMLAMCTDAQTARARIGA